jgi:aspartyl-tRNA synthetase
MFYALPQAPQIFKQLLMTSGFDKYFQIAPCFRDEDARADRSPGEFYQLDFEMSFATQEDVFEVAEKVLYSTFKNFTNKKVSPPPFKHIPYSESMLKYGSDKPDLRNPLIIEDLTDFFSDVDFAPFKNKPVRGIVAPNCASSSKSFFEKMLSFAEEIGMKGLGYISILEDMTLKGPIVKFLTAEKQKNLIARLGLKENDTLFFICDVSKLVDKLAGQIRTELGKRLNLIDTNSFEMCFITDFPMFGLNDDTGAIEFTHNPFSMPQGEMEALETMNPLDIKAYQYDIVCNGVELSSGAVRNHRPDIMVKAFEIAGYTKADIESKFPALFNAFHYGAPPHAGMAPGFDRIVMLLAEQESIREIAAFPMNGNAQDVLLGAPNEVSELQLREAHIKIR